jgi:hypothetical protein
MEVHTRKKNKYDVLLAVHAAGGVGELKRIPIWINPQDREVAVIQR